MARKRDESAKLLSALNRSDKYSTEYQRALDKADSVRSRSWRSRYLKQAERAERLGAKADADIARLTEQAAKLQRRSDNAQRRRAASPGRSGGGGGGGAGAGGSGENALRFDEAEIGIDYSDARGAAKGKAVMVNLRISRRDGAQITMQDARAVARALHAGATADEISQTFNIRGVEWTRPGGNARQGKERDVEAFSAIMRTVGLSHWRIGGVKE